MNGPIARLFMLVVVLFGILIGYTSRWSVFEAKALRDNPQNKRAILEEQRVKRGTIRARSGMVIARSVRRGEIYVRRYPTGSLFGHPVGYYDVNYNKSELELSRNDYLAGRTETFGSIFDQLTGRQREGDDVYTTLDPDAQRVAFAKLAGRKGAVVALDPRSGAVRAMASVPAFDASTVPERGARGAGILNRAVQSGYAPGSTFKVVTAIAAIDSGRYSPSSTVSGRNGKVISGTPLSNFGGASYGNIDLTSALTNSVNTVWAEVGETLGGSTMQKYMDRLGFGDDPPLDLPDTNMRASGNYVRGRPVPATSDRVDVGRMAIGQDKLAVTPLQMAMIAASVANRGELMQPHITDRVVDSDGRIVKRFKASRMSRVMSTRSAAEISAMMQNVVKEGTGTAAKLEGIDVGGKTGTAEVGHGCPNQVWFIGFAPASNPRVAVAATVECSTGTGGVTAAPIARAVMESLLK